MVFLSPEKGAQLLPSNAYDQSTCPQRTQQSDFEIKPHINVICLPSSSDFSDFDSNNCKAAGWGKDAAGKKNQAFFEFELQ